MKSKAKSKHEFALYYDLSTVQPSLKSMAGKTNNQLIITDSDIIHRITRVLRLQQGEQLVLFNRHHNILVELSSIEKKDLVVHLLAVNTNKTFKPTITFFLPLLKREAFDSALYSLVEIGVNAIQLVTTEKTQRPLTPHELERAERTMISAAEQSKNFSLPTLEAPITLAQCVQKFQKDSGLKIFFDPEGIPLIDQINIVREKKPETLSLMIGPEADLTLAEKEQLGQAGVAFCALTPTILRACQAAALSGAIFRSTL
jgi:16S rRNA (uracil1498-N3)-methyltransferase